MSQKISIHQGNNSIYASTATSQSNNHRIRAKMCNPTSNAQKKVNQQNSIRDLWQTIEENFKGSDAFCTLTFDEKELPDDVKLALAELRKEKGKDIKKNAAILKKFFDRVFLNYIRRLETQYAKFEVGVKYIKAYEYKKPGNPHAHIIINIPKDFDKSTMKDIWKNGFVDIVHLSTYSDLNERAEYLTKETTKLLGTDYAICKARWTCSKNLDRVPKRATKVSLDRKIITADDFPKSIGKYELIPNSVETHFNERTSEFIHIARYRRRKPHYADPPPKMRRRRTKRKS